MIDIMQGFLFWKQLQEFPTLVNMLSPTNIYIISLLSVWFWLKQVWSWLNWHRLGLFVQYRTDSPTIVQIFADYIYSDPDFNNQIERNENNLVFTLKIA